MTIVVTQKKAKIYQVLKKNQSWCCTKFIAEALGHFCPGSVLPTLLAMHEAGLVLREAFGKGYYWTLAENPPEDIVARLERTVVFLSTQKAP